MAQAAGRSKRTIPGSVNHLPLISVTISIKQAEIISAWVAERLRPIKVRAPANTVGSIQ
jgi:hypothetical protein